MSEFRGICQSCGEEVRGPCVREISHAWVGERAQGGANKLQGPNKRFTGAVLHPVCHDRLLTREKRGLVGQESLL